MYCLRFAAPLLPKLLKTKVYHIKRENMKKIFNIKKMGAIVLGLVAFAPAASAQDKAETTIAADVVN